ncbi:MAG: type VI secretion system tip protein VgrG [Bacteroidales bacterium]|nr:type VI secretion system tip protein VgrG [Bacteroidales bacterium]
MGPVTITIKSEKETFKFTDDVLSMEVMKEFNKLPKAELKINDGNTVQTKYPFLDGDSFEPGKKIQISLKYEENAQDEETVFVGTAVNRSLEFSGSSPILVIDLYDAAIKMTSSRKSVVFTDELDSDIIKKKLTQNGISEGTIIGTKVTHPHMVQHYATDWDFMVSRAEANGHMVNVNDGKVSVLPPKTSKPALAIELGKDDIYDFELQINGGNQYHQVSSIAWNISEGKFTKEHDGTDDLLKNNGDIPKIVKAMGTEKTMLMHAVPMDTKELQAWSDAQVLKSRLSLLKGWIKIPGRADIQVGQTIEIKGFGDRLSGQNIVSGVRHEVYNGWATYLQIGMDASWFTSQPDVVESKASGLLPGINGLQIGIVQDMVADPGKQFRIPVNIPAFGPSKNVVWARLASIQASDDYGVFFRPEKNDEVVVGFFNDDPRQAVILGAMHSTKNPPPVKIKDKIIKKKGIFTKSKYQLLFDEDNEIITLSTSENNCITIDENNKRMSMKDAFGNEVNLSETGVKINSYKDFEIQAKGNFDITADGNVSITGTNIDLNA